MASLTLTGLQKSFGVTRVLRNIDLQILDGEFLTLVGPSGCGKTTLLRIIAGLDHADDGQVRIGSSIVDSLAPKQRDVAMVFQSYALYPYMTVAQNISLPLTMRRLSRAQRMPLLGGFMPGSGLARLSIDSEVRQVAESLGLLALLERRPAQLSGGQRQRVALARAMVRRPSVFLMDEPLSNLDAKLRVATRAEISQLHRRLGNTFVYVTHDQVEAMTMSDRVALMIEGQILQLATPQEIYDDPCDIRVAEFIGTPKINTIPAIREAHGLRVAGGLWPLPTFSDDTGSAPAADFTVAIRPEWWVLEDGTCATRRACVVRGTVRHLELLGGETLVHVDVEDQGIPLVAKLEPARARRLRIGAAVSLSVERERVLYFDAGGRRVRCFQASAAPISEIRLHD